MSDCETCGKNEETCPIGKPGVASCRNWIPFTSAPEPSPSEPADMIGPDTVATELMEKCHECGTLTVSTGGYCTRPLCQMAYVKKLVAENEKLKSQITELGFVSDGCKSGMNHANYELTKMTERVKELEKENERLKAWRIRKKSTHIAKLRS
jgi:hypothetical protein